MPIVFVPQSQSYECTLLENDFDGPSRVIVLASDVRAWSC
jgi:hypothetical protein